jgi:1-acyl-sn-glycerol-3-phosphate acyltransferase
VFWWIDNPGYINYNLSMDRSTKSNRYIIINNIKYSVFLLLVLVGLGTITLITLLLFPFSNAVKYKAVSLFPNWCVYLMGKILKVKIHIIGEKNIPVKACIIASNHQSIWDGIIFDEILPRHCYIAKKSIASIPIFGWFFTQTLPIYIDQKKRKEAMKTISRQGIRRMMRGIFVVIFPEGERSGSKRVGKYKRGVGVLALSSMRPILPIYQNSSTCFGRDGWYIGGGTIMVLIGKPINSKGRTIKKINKLLYGWAKRQEVRFIKTRY